jgi:hypothetical protein
VWFWRRVAGSAARRRFEAAAIRSAAPIPAPPRGADDEWDDAIPDLKLTGRRIVPLLPGETLPFVGQDLASVAEYAAGSRAAAGHPA